MKRGNVYQRKDGRWESRVNMGMRDGKRWRVSFYSHSQRAARQVLRDALLWKTESLNCPWCGTDLYDRVVRLPSDIDPQHVSRCGNCLNDVRTETIERLFPVFRRLARRPR